MQIVEGPELAEILEVFKKQNQRLKFWLSTLRTIFYLVYCWERCGGSGQLSVGRSWGVCNVLAGGVLSQAECTSVLPLCS